MKALFLKDTPEAIDYGIDWGTNALDASEVIQTSAWAEVSGDGELVVDSNSYDGTSTTVWVSGGTDGVTYVLRNTITTDDGVDERTRARTISIRTQLRSA